MVVARVTDLSATTSDFMENLHTVKNSVWFYVSVTFVCDIFFKERFILLHISEPSVFLFFALKHAQQIFHKCFMSQEIRIVVN